MNDPTQQEIELRGDTLCIQAPKRIEREFGGEGHRTLRCAYGSFQRELPLPTAVNVYKSKATYRDGVLPVGLPKWEGSQSRHFRLCELSRWQSRALAGASATLAWSDR